MARTCYPLIHFMPLVSFLTPEVSIQEVFWCFQEVCKETTGMKWVKRPENKKQKKGNIGLQNVKCISVPYRQNSTLLLLTESNFVLIFQSSQQVFYEINVLKNLLKIERKHLWWSPIFMRGVDLDTFAEVIEVIIEVNIFEYVLLILWKCCWRCTFLRIVDDCI